MLTNSHPPELTVASRESRVPDISVIIVSWNGRHHLDDCLTSLAMQGTEAVETILVDNGSSDGTVVYVNERYPWVKVIAVADNLGYAGANNLGARAARGRLLAFLNNDTVVEAHWLDALRRGLDEHARFGLAAARIVYMHDPLIIDSAGDGLLRWGGAFKRCHGRSIDEAQESIEVFGMCGAACMIVKSIFDELDGFDEHFFASHEDVDLSYRARLRGYRCRYVPDAVVRHRGSATLGRLSAFAVFQGQRNLEWMYLKNTPTSILVRTFLGHVIYDAAAAVHFAKLGLMLPFVRAKIAALTAMPRIIRQRADIQRRRTVRGDAIWALLERRWLATKLSEKRFDVSAAESAP